MLQFNTGELCHFKGYLPENYDGGGLTFDVFHIGGTDTNTGHVTQWGVSIERWNTNNHDIDSGDSYASEQTATAALLATQGKIIKATITVSSGANMDSLAKDEMFRVKLKRVATSDTNTDKAYLLGLVARET